MGVLRRRNLESTTSLLAKAHFCILLSRMCGVKAGFGSGLGELGLRLGGQRCFPPGVGGQQFCAAVWGSRGLIPSCAELLASPEGSWVWNPCWARCVMPSVVLCHQPGVELMC